MSLSSVEIVNLALQKVHHEPIQSLDQDSPAARTAKTLFPHARDGLLRKYRWNFSIGRTTLVADGDSPLFGFTYKFRLPNDYSRMIDVRDETANSISSAFSTDGDQRNYSQQEYPYKIEGGFLHANMVVPYIIYNRELTTTGDFDPLFTDVLVYELAKHFALSLQDSNRRHREMNDRFKEAMLEARKSNAIETTAEHITANEWIGSRFIDNSLPPREGPIA